MEVGIEGYFGEVGFDGIEPEGFGEGQVVGESAEECDVEGAFGGEFGFVDEGGGQ
jgi:hypothetical protein